MMSYYYVIYNDTLKKYYVDFYLGEVKYAKNKLYAKHFDSFTEAKFYIRNVLWPKQEYYFTVQLIGLNK